MEEGYRGLEFFPEGAQTALKAYIIHKFKFSSTGKEGFPCYEDFTPKPKPRCTKLLSLIREKYSRRDSYFLSILVYHCLRKILLTSTSEPSPGVWGFPERPGYGLEFLLGQAPQPCGSDRLQQIESIKVSSFERS